MRARLGQSAFTRLTLASLGCLMLSGGAGAASPEAGQWAAASRPSAGETRVLGAHGAGCIAGAVAMPLEGPGWEVVRAARNRFWGHPALVATLQSVGAAARAQGLPPIWIGDLGQPRGGPMPWGHSSHQIGLDADIWLDVSPRGATPAGVRDRHEVPSLVQPGGMSVDPARYTERHAWLMRIAAEQPAVERIFINPAIKQALCRNHAGEPWLRRVRPWPGHDSHFHIRLRCPAGQPACQDQAPIPPGDGCDSSLDWWFSAEARNPPPATRLPAAPRLPAACAAVLRAP